MVDAYGPRGLRVIQLERIMDVVISRLPYYTSLLFSEPGLKFSHVCDATNIHIYAHRIRTNPKGVVEEFQHDIASFSGGEAKKLSVVFILTLADCVSAAKKTNILFLDEVDSPLDDEGEFLFINELLPRLADDFESVFVISHREAKQAAIFDQWWDFSKKNHSTVITKTEYKNG